MTFDPEIHRRRSIRLAGYDYSHVGVYFITICTQGRESLFGEISNCEMLLNDAGQMVSEVWNQLPVRFPAVALDEFVVMPNHMHGIIIINDAVGALLAAPDFDSKPSVKGAASSAPTLGKIIRAFKSISAIEINRILDRQGQPLWQRNYYERIIRNDAELAAIREYIASNPANWADDEEYAP